MSQTQEHAPMDRATGEMSVEIFSAEKKKEGQRMNRTIFQVRMQKLREEKRISRARMSERCGLEQSAIRRYERGEREPKLSTLIQIADFFGVTIDYLAGRTDEK